MASFTDLSQLLHSEATNFSAYPRRYQCWVGLESELDLDSDSFTLDKSHFFSCKLGFGCFEKLMQAMVSKQKLRKVGQFLKLTF